MVDLAAENLISFLEGKGVDADWVVKRALRKVRWRRPDMSKELYDV